MATIDRVGTFTGVVTESAYSVTSKGGFPQWVGKLLAEKKYVSEPDEMKHFGITEPGYVDWNYDESIIAYLVLFTDKGELQNAKQLAAIGWDGEDFQTLSDLAGKKLLFRTEENNYNNATTIKVGWVDTVDAPPERTLKNMDADTLKKMNAQYLGGKPKAPPKPATAVAAKASVAAGKPAPAAIHSQSTSPAVATPAAPVVAQPAPADPKPAAAPAALASAAAAAPTAGKTTPPKKGSKAPPPPATGTENVAPGLPTSMTKMEAWEYLFEPAVIGQNEVAVVTDAFIAACSEVGENVEEKDFTGEMWAKVRNVVLKDLGIKIA